MKLKQLFMPLSGLPLISLASPGYAGDKGPGWDYKTYPGSACQPTLGSYAGDFRTDYTLTMSHFSDQIRKWFMRSARVVLLMATALAPELGPAAEQSFFSPESWAQELTYGQGWALEHPRMPARGAEQPANHGQDNNDAHDCVERQQQRRAYVLSQLGQGLQQNLAILRGPQRHHPRAELARLRHAVLFHRPGGEPLGSLRGVPARVRPYRP